MAHLQDSKIEQSLWLIRRQRDVRVSTLDLQHVRLHSILLLVLGFLELLLRFLELLALLLETLLLISLALLLALLFFLLFTSTASSASAASSATSSTPTSSTVPLVVLAIGLRVVDQLAVLIEVGEAAQIAVLA